jgi:hypothetical protein
VGTRNRNWRRRLFGWILLYCFSEAVLESRRGYIFSCVVVVVRGS